MSPPQSPHRLHQPHDTFYTNTVHRGPSLIPHGDHWLRRAAVRLGGDRPMRVPPHRSACAVGSVAGGEASGCGDRMAPTGESIGLVRKIRGENRTPQIEGVPRHPLPLPSLPSTPARTSSPSPPISSRPIPIPTMDAVSSPLDVRDRKIIVHGLARGPPPQGLPFSSHSERTPRHGVALRSLGLIPRNHPNP